MTLTSENPMHSSGIESVPEALASAPVLSVRDLTTSFRTNDGWKSVIRGISFDVAPRETVAIVGESGSGKSVTSLSIMRLLQPNSRRIEGSVRLNGRELLSLEEEQMRRVRGNGISMIFQEPMTSLNPIFPIGKQIAEALTVHTDISEADAKAEVIRLLDKVRIPNALSRFDEYPHQFSGGMRQRVMIAMALASRPKLLIADEPTTALDVTIQGQILDLIKTLQDEEGMSVLFIPMTWVWLPRSRTAQSSCIGAMRSRPERPATFSIGVGIPTPARFYRRSQGWARWADANCPCVFPASI